MKDCLECIVRNRAICNGLSPDELAALSKLGRTIRLARGESLIWEGSDAVIVANVIDGVLKLSQSTADGREQIVGVSFASDFIGRPYGQINPYSAVALTDARLCVFPRSAFEQFAHDHPELEHKLLKRTLDELDRARDWMLLLGQKSANERIATLLLEMSERVPGQGCGFTADQASRFELPLDRQQIGDLLGLTIETVSRQFTRLRSSGLIDLPDRRTVIIHDRDSLADLAMAA